MIPDELPWVVYIAVSWLIVLWAVALFGCSAPDRQPPVTYYRELYGFTIHDNG